jgi:hypothetical protein
MKTIQAYYDGSVFVPLTSVNVALNQPVLVTVLEKNNTKEHDNHYDSLFGALSAESFMEISEALKDTEGVDIFEW